MKLVKKDGEYYVLQKNDRIVLMHRRGHVIKSFIDLNEFKHFNYNMNIDEVLEDYEDVLGYNVSKFRDLAGAIEERKTTLHPAIASLLNDTVVNFGKEMTVNYALYMEDSISVGEKFMKLSEFFMLLNQHKNKNRWLYNEIYEENVEYLV